MGLETATYINELVVTNPVGATDPKSQGDDHLRLIKTVLKNTFPNINSAVNPTDEELNRLVGVTDSVESMRGLAYADQAAPYSIAAGDKGKLINITSAGTITLGNLANEFACLISAVGGALTITSSSGTLEWFSAGGVALPTGNRSVLRGGIIVAHRYNSQWRIWGGGIS